MKWPVLKDGLDKIETREGYIELRGFKGVLVGVVGDGTGKIIDFRDHTKSPSFNNLIQMPSEDLKDLAERAIGKQIEILKEQDTDNSALIKQLKTELASILTVNSKKCDREWKKDGF